jgi:hypothetical protein
MVVDAAKGSDEVYMWYVALSNVGDDREAESKVCLIYRHHHYWYEYRNNRGQGRVWVRFALAVNGHTRVFERILNSTVASGRHRREIRR